MAVSWRNKKLKRIWQKAFTAKLRYKPGGNEENHENLNQERQMSLSKF
jgi:hypothetical protein